MQFDTWIDFSTALAAKAQTFVRNKVKLTVHNKTHLLYILTSGCTKRDCLFLFWFSFVEVVTFAMTLMKAMARNTAESNKIVSFWSFDRSYSAIVLWHKPKQLPACINHLKTNACDKHGADIYPLAREWSDGDPGQTGPRTRKAGELSVLSFTSLMAQKKKKDLFWSLWW